jgi:hypothetical protein
MNEELENKVKGVLGLYNFHKYQLNTVQRVALLTVWIEICIKKEEYEVAASLQKEMDKIINGEEEYYIVSPSTMVEIQREDIENTIKQTLESKPTTVKKKYRFINNWGSKNFELFSLSFNSFRVMIFNFGICLK